MKILLTYLCNYDERRDYYASLLPYGLTSIASFIEKKGYDVTLANFSFLGYKKAVKKIIEEKYDVVGISIFTFNRGDSFKLITSLKKKNPKVKIVIGGPHATFLSEEILKRYKEVDFVIKGEGEEAFLQLVKKLEKKENSARIIRGQRCTELDTFPQPSEFSGKLIDVNPNEQYKFLISSRGCPYGCNFCSSPSFWERKAYFRSAENLFNDVERLYNKYGIIYFSIRDDNFTLRKDRVIEFSKKLQKSNMFLMWNCQARVDSIDEEMLYEMKLAGLEHIQYGVESGSERILDKYHKSIKLSDVYRAAELTRKVGVYLSIYLMTGMVDETEADVNQTVKLIKKILPGDGIVSPVAYYPGTELYNTMKEQGHIDDNIWFKSNDPGIYLRDGAEISKWIKKLVKELGLIRGRSWYTSRNFNAHRKVMGDDCWVTDILEGDFCMDEDLVDDAYSLFNKVISKYPSNIWGYMRLGKLNFMMGDYEEAVNYFRTVTNLVPNYYGAWLKLAESSFASGDKKFAGQCIKKAEKLNKFDKRIGNLKKVIK